MTITQALKALDGEGRYAAKRPSMNGYVFKVDRPAEAEGGKPTASDVVFVAKDGTRASFGIGADGAVEDGFELKVDSAFVENALLSEDWELFPTAEVEKARTGEGRW